MIQHDFLNQKPMQILDDFLNVYSSICEIDMVKAKNIILECLKYYKGNGSQPEYLKDLELRWYSSLNGTADYSVYNDEYYFATDLFPCFVLYSRSYILDIDKNPVTRCAIDKSDSIIDLGCGLGYSTAMLKQLCPKKRIIGTNLRGTDQYVFCDEISKIYNFELIESESGLNEKIDMVFASEYFEHIHDAPDNVVALIKQIKPDYLLLANTFRSKSVGHFNYYKYADDQMNIFSADVSNKKISRVFNKSISSNGYKKIKTGLWNNRPAFWEKIEA